MHLRGCDELAERCPKLLGRCERNQLLIRPAVIEVDGETPIGQVPLIEIAKMLDGSSAMTFGVYNDHYVEEEGQWRYARQHWSFKYRGSPDLTAAFIDTPDYGISQHASGGRADLRPESVTSDRLANDQVCCLQTRNGI